MNMYEKATTEVIHWTETLNRGGNPYVYHPQPAMLLEGGMKILRSYSQQGRNAKLTEKKSFVYVIYDADYVSEWLLRNFLDRFPNITHVQARELMTAALKLRKQRSEAKNGEAS